MSRKLATLVKDSAVPGKWKRVLEALAAFANNDGTNIYPSKEKLGKKAGCSPDTVYRNLPDLMDCGVISQATSHTCKVDNCNKGGTHFTGQWGHYTTVYKIDISFLQNAETYLSAKYQKVCAAKCRKVGVANCGTTQALRETPAPLGILDSSALTCGGSEVVSEADGSLAALAHVADCNTEEKPVELTSEEEKLLWVLLPVHNSNMQSDPEVKDALHYVLMLTHTVDVDAFDLLLYNRAHKKAGLYIRTPEDYRKALVGDEDGNYRLVNEYIEHDFATCNICKNTSREKKCIGYAPIKAHRVKRREIAEKRRWLSANNGWDFSKPSPEASDEFLAIIKAGKKGKWVPEGVSVDAKLRGDEARYYHAAMNRMVAVGAYMEFKMFEALVAAAKEWDAISDEVAEYDRWHPQDKAAAAAAGGGFDLEEA